MIPLLIFYAVGAIGAYIALEQTATEQNMTNNDPWGEELPKWFFVFIGTVFWFPVLVYCLLEFFTAESPKEEPKE